MGWMTNLRILAYCRRFVKAQESIAQSLETLATITKQRWDEEHQVRAKSKVDFSTFDPVAASERYEEEQRILHGGL